MYLKCKIRCFICEEKGRKVCRRQARKNAPLNSPSSFLFSFLYVVIGNIITSTIGATKERKKCHCCALHVAHYKGCQYHDVVWQLHEMQQQLQIGRQKEGGQGGLG